MSNFYKYAIGAKGQKWGLCEPDKALLQSLLRSGFDFLEARILALRNINPDEAQKILLPRLKTQMPDPYTMLGMERAISVILNAVEQKQKITIFADYDVDGGTSSAILKAWFDHIGYEINIFVPDRIKDGYGPNPQLMNSIKESGTDLLICVDCGGAAYDALNEADKIGLGVVVFDHHLMSEDAPKALAIVNPNQHGDNSGLGHLTAAGVCFMAVVALNRAITNIDKNKGGFDSLALLDLVALGTICDVAPLTGLNRVFVAQGQKILDKKSRTGLRILGDIAGLKKQGSVYAAAWVLGPRLNAGGRISDSSLTVELLTTNNEKRAKELSLNLEQINQERREIESEILDEAVAMVQNNKNGELEAPILFIGKEGWHPGIIGIVAGRLKERFNKPAIVFGTVNKNDTLYKGSGRSVDGIDLGSLVKSCVDEGLLSTGGGHKMAAGLSFEPQNINKVRNFFYNNIRNYIVESQLNQPKIIDANLDLSLANFTMVDSMERLAPFGTGWPEPIFCLNDVSVYAQNIMNGGHLRFMVKDNDGNKLNAVAFGVMGTKAGELLHSKRPINLIVKLKKDEWRGTNAVQTEVIDVFEQFEL